MVRIVSLMLLFLVGSLASAQDLPRFDIDSMCRAAPRLEPSDQNTAQACIRDETQARTELEQHWTSFDARQRDMCVQETNVGGSPSYVDVLTCIQIASGNAPATAPRRARRNP